MFFYNEVDGQDEITGSADPYFSNVSLLLKMDSDFSDSSQYAHSITVNGNTAISTTESKYGGASGYFDGVGDYLSLGASNAFNFGNQDFTVEFWMNFQPYSGYKRIFVQDGPTENYGTQLQILLDSSTTKVWVYSGNSAVDVMSTSQLSHSTWHHVAITRENHIIKIYFNGVLDRSKAYSSSLVLSPNSGNPRPYIGAYSPSVSFFPGYLDDFRITKGLARYTANFTPPDSLPTS